MVRKEYPGRGNSVLCPVAGAGVSSERVRKASVARAESADRTCRELRMGPLARATLHRTSWGPCLYLENVRKTGKGEQHEGPAEECASESQ